ncbi:MAG: hypothetical protein M3416_01610 [Acidobacteriota bacterium]|nr:hypothetical protein [Acidobacteriota bacterium]
MLLSKRATLTTVTVTFLSLLVVSAYAMHTPRLEEPTLGIELALKKPFYIPASRGDGGMSAVVRTTLTESDSEREVISAVKLTPVMEGDEVKVTVFALIGDASNIIKCRDWDSLKSIKIETYVAGLDEEVSISKLGDYGVNFEDGVLKFRVVPRKVFPQWGGWAGEGCGCASCGTLQCCPNPGYCINCGKCGFVCCNG